MAKQKKAKKAAFPKLLTVVEAYLGEGPELIRDLAHVGDGERVATYELLKVEQCHRTETVEWTEVK